ncbi:MAG: hypothetical protein RLZZ387_5619 [Chloroflexota bacterium]|jgi:4-amino-4-deoxy-L-arabinose transferase-like glycosyltransferase
MIATSKTPARLASLPRAQARAALGYLAVALAALLPRALDLGGFLTVDEANFWLARSATFLDALRRGDWAATAISTHPGVTTMWLGSLGLLLREALVDRGLLAGDFPTALALMRLPGALVHTAAIVAGYALLRRLLPAAALPAALLWAADPFVVAYSRLLHVDALAGTFITLSILAALVAAKDQGPTPEDQEPKAMITPRSPGRWFVVGGPSTRIEWGWCALSGLLGGLALLSKTPALILFPVIGIILVYAALRSPQDRADERSVFAVQQILQRSAFSLQRFAIWSLAALLTALALWPALWADPLGALAQLRTGVEAEGAQPHMLGNFFLGRQDDAPGPLFYPVALALRTTPLTLLGLLLLPVAARRLGTSELRALAMLALYVLLLTAALSLFPKKFNRYIVPAFPALDIIAATALTAALAWLAARLGNGARGVRAQAGAVAVLAGLALGNVASWHPYSIAAFNQALGGAQAGARTFAVGWGEGFEQVAAWLNEQPDITGVSTVSRIPVVQAPYMRPRAAARTPEAGSLPPGAGYLVVYVSQVQRGSPSPPFDAFYGQAPPLHVVRIHSVDYAWVYHVPPPVQEERAAQFGQSLALRGFSQEGAPERGATMLLRLQWLAIAPAPLDYTLFAHLIGPDGRRYAQVDIPYPTSGWEPGRYVATELPIAIPADAPGGAYRLVVGLYAPADGQRLTLRTTVPSDDTLSGPHALPLTTFELR